MRITVVTMFPEYLESPLATSLVGKAIADAVVEVDVVDLRQFGAGVHRTLDDAPFGGGAGMVMMAEPLAQAVESVEEPGHRVLFAAAGSPLKQEDLDRWAGIEHLVLVCGRYEGVDERFADSMVDEEVSIGDYVLLGGEAAALAVIEGVVRLVPGVLGNPESVVGESYRDGLLEEPQFTRPAEWRGIAVPDVLVSGNHGEIDAWRRRQREERTRSRRPDLWAQSDDESSPTT
ncbi:MAG: tRNA (guanosine(37)-N1)-methyltransferase TrmD [Acidimicrobiia bacterium]|nr:tRNA (guanosine(37)-N1)-methyltransferase TrmD [Acidimicrobiia bacterium]NNC75217.1 tRNA (guanosine(37)-N1)-methyltransferase TrmD [Acidimicrobiia bacterium]